MAKDNPQREVIFMIYRFAGDSRYRYAAFECQDERERFVKNFGPYLVCVKTETVKFRED